MIRIYNMIIIKASWNTNAAASQEQPHASSAAMLYPCIGSLCRGVTTQLHVHFPTLTLFTTAGTAARVRRCSLWRHIYAISPQPSTHFMSPCEVRFTLLPLLLTSPCGVLPLQAEWVRGVGGLRVMEKEKDVVCCWVWDRLRGLNEMHF